MGIELAHLATEAGDKLDTASIPHRAFYVFSPTVGAIIELDVVGVAVADRHAFNPSILGKIHLSATVAVSEIRNLSGVADPVTCGQWRVKGYTVAADRRDLLEFICHSVQPAVS